jgi:hypothetical protein
MSLGLSGSNSEKLLNGALLSWVQLYNFDRPWKEIDVSLIQHDMPELL